MLRHLFYAFLVIGILNFLLAAFIGVDIAIGAADPHQAHGIAGAFGAVSFVGFFAACVTTAIEHQGPKS